MGLKKNEVGLYFQAIERFFFGQRGSPFFLSSTELNVIADWKKQGIPVQVVLDGIRDCFSCHRKKPGRANKIHSLLFCRSFVLRAFESYKERKVGGGLKDFAEEERAKQLKEAVQKFIKTCPEEIRELRAIFSQVKKSLSQEVDEEGLEKMEQDVERLLLRKVLDSEKKKIRDEMLKEYPDKKGKEHARILEMRIIKHMREKYKVPHISLYYY
jgi:hypothetical protein